MEKKNDDYCEISNFSISEKKYKKQLVIKKDKTYLFDENEISIILDDNMNSIEREKKDNESYESFTLYLENLEFLKNSIKPDIDNTWTISDIVNSWSPIGWSKTFSSSKEILVDLSSKLEERYIKIGKRIVPDKINLFSAFELTPLQKIRVVIIGQDPYYSMYSDGKPVAIGSAFSTVKTQKYQPSLKNIYEEISRTEKNFVFPHHGNLEHWQKQGVFLLNMSLTTEEGEANAHGKYGIWMGFIKNVLDDINENNPKCIYLLWGKEAQKIAKYLKGTNIVLTSGHPSPLSVRFFKENGHFAEVNRLLDPERLRTCSLKSPEYINPKYWGKINWNV